MTEKFKINHLSVVGVTWGGKNEVPTGSKTWSQFYSFVFNDLKNNNLLISFSLKISFADLRFVYVVYFVLVTIFTTPGVTYFSLTLALFW